MKFLSNLGLNRIIYLIFIVVQLACRAQEFQEDAQNVLNPSQDQNINNNLKSDENTNFQDQILFSSPYDMSFAQWEKNLEAWNEHFKIYTEKEIKCKNSNENEVNL